MSGVEVQSEAATELDIESQLPVEAPSELSIEDSCSAKVPIFAESDSNVANPYLCYICYETKIPSELSSNDSFQLSCGHIFCKPCLQNFVSSCITDGNSAPKCFHPVSKPTHSANNIEVITSTPQFELKCNTAFSADEIDQLIIDEAMRLKFERFRFMSMNPNGRECPFEGCGELQIGDPNQADMACTKYVYCK